MPEPIHESELEEDDDLEFIDALEAAAENPGEDENPEAIRNLEAAKETRLYRLAMESALPRKQALAFLSAVQLDELRKPQEKLGLKDLYRACAEHGTRYWLNPARYITTLHNRVLNFSGPHDTLTPFTELLTELATEGLSPAAFCRYVLYPRLQTDYDWRHWQKNHLPALRSIARLLLDLKQTPPFDQEKITTPFLTLARDVVLVKYVGRPLSAFTSEALEDQDFTNAYAGHWRGLQMKHSFFIYFLKRNILPLLYWLTGRISGEQLSQLSSRIAGLENDFEQFFPQALFELKPEDPPIHLYARNYEASLQARRKRNYKFFDFVREMQAYLDLTQASLRTGAGVHLASFLAGRLSNAYNPDDVLGLNELIGVITNGRGRLHYYKWHVRKFLGLSSGEQVEYLNRLRAGNNRDPDYPDPARIFAVPLHDVTGNVRETAEDLGLGDLGVPGGARNHNLTPEEIDRILGGEDDGSFRGPSYRDLLDSYLLKHPEQKELLDSYRDDVLNRRDRNWDDEHRKSLDAAGPQLHDVLLKAVFQGLSYDALSNDFEGLHREFGHGEKYPHLDLKQDFSLPLKKVGEISRLKEQEIRKQINLDLIDRVWRVLSSDESPPPERNLAHLNEASVKTRQAKEAAAEAFLELEGRGAPKKELDKKRKSRDYLAGKQDHMERVLELFPDLDPTRQFLTGLLVASKEAKPGDPFAHDVLFMLIGRYRAQPPLADRLNFLIEDVRTDALDYQQLLYIINSLELLNDYLMDDPDFLRVAEGGAPPGDGGENRLEKERQARKSKQEQNWNKLMEPYVSTRDKRISMDSLEAAFRKLISLGKLQAERARWLELLEAIEQKDNRFFREMSVGLSKSFMDAYYGHMGGICLSRHPEMITRQGFYNIRLTDFKERRITGMAVVYMVQESIPEIAPEGFGFAFAFNPLSSLLTGLSRARQLYLYLQYRLLLEDLCRELKLPIVLPGREKSDIISNRSDFALLILSYERIRRPIALNNAHGLSLVYHASDYRKAYLMIHPDRPETFRAEADIKRLQNNI